jgi:hypothetical protein
MNQNLKKLPKGWETILADEYQAGASDVEVRARLKMTESLWDVLYHDATGSEFKAVVDFGRMLAKAWWLSQARSNLKSRQFNANLWLMVMKNQYGYSEKSTVTTKHVEEMSQDELDSRIKEAMKKFDKVRKA